MPTLAAADLKIYDFPDPAWRGNRLKLGQGRGFPTGRVYLYYEVERLPESRLGDTVLQSDYVTKWTPHTNAGELQDKTKEAADGRD